MAADVPARFVLDARLAADTFDIGALALCRLRLMNDARFPWLILVPQRPDLVELSDLSDRDVALLWDEILLASRVLQAVEHPYKLNIGALGNQVRQLHIHVIARAQEDAAWPAPVWGFGTPRNYGAEDAGVAIEVLRAALGDAIASG